MTYIPGMDMKLDILNQDMAAHNQKVEQDVQLMKRQLAGVGTIIAKSSKAADTTLELVRELHRWIMEQETVQLNLQCLHALYFSQLKRRQDDVKHAHEQTFQWIFEKRSGEARTPHDAKFRDWLRLSDPDKNLFWVAGKARAGKSTLMKCIAQHDRLDERLRGWTRSHSLNIFGYYFWRHGSEIQRSIEGMVRSLLYQVLIVHPELIRHAFPFKDWLSGGLQFQFSKGALFRGLRLAMQEACKRDLRFFFLIDGLDEFDDRDEDDDETSGVQDLLDFLRALRSFSSFKIQEPTPTFLPQDLTRNDIRSYVREKLEKTDVFKAASAQDANYFGLEDEITTAAQGVFLWVVLATTCLLEGIHNGDSMLHLQDRLRRLPRKLELLFEHILSTVHPSYKSVCARSLLFARRPEPVLFHMYLDEDELALCLRRRQTSLEELMDARPRMVNQLNARCRGLIKVNSKEHLDTKDQNDVISSLWGARVTVAHRTITEFINSKRMRTRLLELAAFVDDMRDLEFRARIAELVTIAHASHCYIGLDIPPDPTLGRSGHDLNNVISEAYEKCAHLIKHCDGPKELAYWQTLQDVMEMEPKSASRMMWDEQWRLPTKHVALEMAVKEDAVDLFRHKVKEHEDPIGILNPDEDHSYLLAAVVDRRCNIVPVLLEYCADPNDALAKEGTAW